jgi:hypothetical protein
MSIANSQRHSFPSEVSHQLTFKKSRAAGAGSKIWGLGTTYTEISRCENSNAQILKIDHMTRTSQGVGVVSILALSLLLSYIFIILN